MVRIQSSEAKPLAVHAMSEIRFNHIVFVVTDSLVE